MRKTTIFLTVLAASAMAFADDVVVGGLPYSGVTVKSADEFSITIRTRGGLRAKDLADVSTISLDRSPLFNKAEKLLEAKRYAQAVGAYDKARKAESVAWRKKLIRARRLLALKRGGLLARAVREWLAITDENASSKDNLSRSIRLAPSKAAVKGSKENAGAIVLLEAKDGKLKAGAYRTAVRRLLMKLYLAEGRAEKAAKLAEQLTGSQSVTPGGGAKTPSTAGLQTKLEAARAFIDRRQADKVLEIIEPSLKRFTPEQLSQALLLRGKAQLIKYRKAKDRRMLLQAGLNFMRVVVFYPQAQETSEALYLAGIVNIELGNKQAARMALTKVGAGSGKFSKSALNELKKLGS